MTSEIFITGSSGVLGYDVLRHFHQTVDATVHGVSRRALAGPSSEPKDALPNLVVDDLFAADWLAEASRDATLVHLAGLANPRVTFENYATLSEQEIWPHIKMMETLLARGWRGHLVYISSGGAIYGDVDQLPIPETQTTRPKGYYALQKISIENALVFLANQYDFRLTILRVSNPYGSTALKQGQGVVPILLKAALKAETFTAIGTGEALRDYIHISDLCRAIEMVCMNLGDTDASPINIVNVGSGTGTSLNALIEMVTELTGRQLHVARSDPTFDVKSNVLDIALADQLLGWQPQVDIREGLKRMLDAFERAED